MIVKSLLMTSVAASLVLIPATQVRADAGDFIAGAIVGAIVNHAASQPRKKTYTKTYTKKKVSKPRIPTTQAGRQIQTSLNYFGFNSGSVDGQLGRKSREAITNYQVYLGYAGTGQLSTFEQDLLINSYNRAQAGGYATQQLIAANPEGVRGLLKQFRAEMAGGAPVMAGMVPVPHTTTTTTTVMVPGQQMAVAPMPVAPMHVGVAPMAVAPMAVAPTVVAPAPAPVAVAVAPMAIAPQPAAPVLPTSVPVSAPVAAAPLPNLFSSAPAVQPTLSVFCTTVGQKAAANGGFITVTTMIDANAALSEQFCLARDSAMAVGTQLAQGLGATPDQINAHCAAYGEQMAVHVAALGAKPRDAVMADVAGFAQSTGIPNQDLAATAKVCMSVGYRDDNLDQAIGSGLLLAAVAETAYGELMGHHLSQGYGTTKRMDLAGPWYQAALSAAAVQPVLATAQVGRLDVVRMATNVVLNGGQAALAPLVAPQPASTLPTFSISQ